MRSNYRRHFPFGTGLRLRHCPAKDRAGGAPNPERQPQRLGFQGASGLKALGLLRVPGSEAKRSCLPPPFLTLAHHDQSSRFALHTVTPHEPMSTFQRHVLRAWPSHSFRIGAQTLSSTQVGEQSNHQKPGAQWEALKAWVRNHPHGFDLSGGDPTAG